MGINRVFFPQAALDQWLATGLVDLAGDELTILAEGRRYRIVEAARVLREVSGLADASDLVGRVKTVRYLNELGAEVVESSLVCGDNAYDIIPGFLAAPVGSFAQHIAEQAKGRDGPGPVLAQPSAPGSDEDLLVQFLLKRL